MTRLGKELDRIYFVVRMVASRKCLARFLYYENDQKEIARCKEMITQSLRIFHVYSDIQLRHDIFELKNARLAQHGDALIANVHVSKVPPAKPHVFVGREDLVSEGVAILTKQQAARVAILGTGGIGKTSLSLALLHHEKIQMHFGGRCYFVPCDAINSINSLIHSILQVLDVSPSSGRDLLSTLHDCLDTSDPLLLVLDNFETPWQEAESPSQVETVLSRIAAVDSLTLVITARGTISPPGVAWVTLPKDSKIGLPALSLPAARQAFWAHCSREPAKDLETRLALDALLKELGYMPLAVKLLAQVGQHDSPVILLKRWKKEKNALIEVHGSKPDRLTSIDFSIALVINSPVLAGEKDATQFLAFLAYLPDGVPQWEETLEHMASGFQNCYRLSGLLQNAALVYSSHSKTLKMLSPIRHHIQDKYTLQGGHIAALEGYYITLINKYDVSSGSGLAAAVEGLSPHVNNILSVIKNALAKHPSKVLTNAVLKMSRFLYEIRPTCDLLFEMVKVLDVVDMKEMEPVAFHVMGEILCREGKYPEAREKLNSAYHLFAKSSNSTGQAQCLQSLGELSLREYQYDEAEQNIEQALALYLKNKDPLGIAQCQRSLGELLFLQDQYPDAREKFQDAHDKFAEIDDTMGVAQCLRGLGEVLRMEDEYAEGREALEKAHAHFEELGNIFWTAQCLKSMGDLLLREDRYAEAAQKIEAAEALFRKLQTPLGRAQCLQTRGELAKLEDRYATAKTFLHDARALFTRINDRLGLAQCLKSLSEIYLYEDAYVDARQRLEEAYALFVALQKPLWIAQCLQGWGELLGMEENFALAEEKLREAHTQYAALENQLGEAQCLRALGDILRLEDHYDEAGKVLGEAYELFADLEDMLGEAQCLRSFAEVLRLVDKFDEATTKIERSHELSVKIGDLLGQAQCLQVLGEILKSERKLLEAKEKLQQAHTLFVSIGDVTGAAQCEESLTSVKMQLRE
ncbi:hypothetical protein HGRIS_014343 [Hohenbuehelia grisea]